MKKSTGLQYHPNQEDKSGNPTFASSVRLNFSANEPRSTEREHTPLTARRARLIKSWLREIIRSKKSLK